MRGPRGLARLSDALAALHWRRVRGARRENTAVFVAFLSALGEGGGEGVRPLSLRRGVLRVEVASAARLHELTAFGQQICVARTNALLRAPLVRGIEFRLASDGPLGARG
ncbi:MAG TPA: hypothetical protein VFI25_14700 [Planctomycetota bacterium]|jgi:hypothetical protein|nr:hypothetical protein [Planctomycetota bacterium]